MIAPLVIGRPSRWTIRLRAARSQVVAAERTTSKVTYSCSHLMIDLSGPTPPSPESALFLLAQVISEKIRKSNLY